MPRTKATPGAVLPGWHAECYQATAGPVMLAFVPQGFFVLVALPSLLAVMVAPKILLLTGPLYLAAAIGTMWEPYWYPMLKEYLGYESHYEG